MYCNHHHIIIVLILIKLRKTYKMMSSSHWLIGISSVSLILPTTSKIDAINAYRKTNNYMQKCWPTVEPKNEIIFKYRHKTNSNYPRPFTLLEMHLWLCCLLSMGLSIYVYMCLYVCVYVHMNLYVHVTHIYKYRSVNIFEYLCDYHADAYIIYIIIFNIYVSIFIIIVINYF